MSSLPNHYRTLEVPQHATAAEVKQAYRRLAKRYHPDADPNNAHAPARFREVQEAWQVLGHEQRRARYDEELWLSGMQQRARTHTAITPQWILHEVNRLQKHLSTIDVYRMNQRALAQYISLLLSDAHMAILLNEVANSGNTNTQIATRLAATLHLLRYEDAQPLTTLLQKLAEGDATANRAIQSSLWASRHAARRNAWLPWAILIATALMAAAMYWYGRR